MTRRRATRATVAKRPPGPVLPEGEEAKNLDEKERRSRVERLIKDFETEMVARKKNIHDTFQGVLRQLDRAYTVGLIRIPPQSRGMLFSDFLDRGCQIDTSDVADLKPALDNVNAVVDEAGEVAPDEEEEEEVTSKTVRKTRKTRGRAPTTTRKGRGSKISAASQMLVTPGNFTSAALSQWNTPVITPKFDPRQFYTPAVGAAGSSSTAAATGGLSVARKFKPGEIAVSMDGSPIFQHVDGQSVVGPQALVVPLTGEMSLEGLNKDSVQSIYGAVEKLYKSLKAVVNCPTQEK